MKISLLVFALTDSLCQLTPLSIGGGGNFSVSVGYLARNFKIRLISNAYIGKIMELKEKKGAYLEAPCITS